jgi:hypothetical protein
VKRAVLALALATALAVSCTGGDAPARTSGPEPTAATGSPASPTPSADETGSAAAALERLCPLKAPKPGSEDSSVPPEGPTPPAIQQVMDELEQIRGFSFDHPVVAAPVTQQEIAKGFRESLDAAFPVDLSERRSLVWQTIGVIDPGVDIRTDLQSYGSSEVIGYYDTQTEELVFLGGEDPTPLESVTLAHELTHAIDDQRFGLERIDRINATCRDDRAEASLGLVEGNATYFMYEWARSFLTPDEQVELVQESADQQPAASHVAPFIEALQIWPYTAGLAFVTSLDERGGVDAIDDAFTRLPVSSEQVMHPERYPDDVPTPLDIPDVSEALGPRWKDLDVMEVGEVWLDLALKQRLDADPSNAASAGWDGGLYRAWSDGDDVAVVLETAWDSEDDAKEFADAMGQWLDEGATESDVTSSGDRARVLFASSAAVLQDLTAAAAGG